MDQVARARTRRTPSDACSVLTTARLFCCCFKSLRVAKEVFRPPESMHKSSDTSRALSVVT